MSNNSIINALEGVKFRKRIIDKTKAELNERLADSFSVFSYIPFNEVSMSNLFKDLLDIRGNHGQGGVFLNKFLELICTKLEINTLIHIDNTLYEINTEVRTTRIVNSLRRIDILLNWGKSFAIAIENKPYDKDQPNQLDDYTNHLESEFHGNYIIVYFSDHDATDTSISVEKREFLKSQKKYVQINFTDDAIEWLAKSRKEVKAYKIKSFIDDLINKIMERQGNKKEINQEIVDYILTSDDNLNAVYEMINSLDPVLNKIALEWSIEFKTELEIQTNRTFHVTNKTEGKRINITIQDANWGHNFCGLFDIGDNSGLFYSMVINSEKERKNLPFGLTPWVDKEGNCHNYKIHELNTWHSDFSSVMKFKKSLKSTIQEILIMIDFLDNLN